MTEQQTPYGSNLAESQSAFTPASDEPGPPKVLTHTEWMNHHKKYEGYERLFDYVSFQLSYIQEIIDVSFQTSVDTEEKEDSLFSLIDFTVKNVTENIHSALEYEWETLGHTAIKIDSGKRKILDAVRVLPQTPNEQRKWEELTGFFSDMKAQESEKSVQNEKERDFIRAARSIESRVENFIGYVKAMESLFHISDTTAGSVFYQMVDELASRLKKAFAEANS